MKNNTMNYQIPFKNITEQSKQASQVSSTVPQCKAATHQLRRYSSFSNPMVIYLDKTTPKGGTAECELPHLPFVPSGAAAPRSNWTHPWLSLSSPLQSVREEVKVATLPLSQEGVPQLQHVAVHDTVLPKRVICNERKHQCAKQETD